MYPNPLLNLNIFILSHVVKYIVLPCNDYVLVNDYVLSLIRRTRQQTLQESGNAQTNGRLPTLPRVAYPCVGTARARDLHAAVRWKCVRVRVDSAEAPGPDAGRCCVAVRAPSLLPRPAQATRPVW